MVGKGLMNTYACTLPTQRTLEYFKPGSWYIGSQSESGIIAKFSTPEHSDGWWGSSASIEHKLSKGMGTFAEGFFRLITPERWELITDKKIINQLEKLLSNERN